MSKFEKLFFISLLSFCWIATGCSDEAPLLPGSREEALLLLAGSERKSWMLSSMKYNGTNITIFIKSCDKDNIYTFFRNGEGEVRGNVKKCTQDEPDILATGYWQLSEDLKTLTLEMGSSIEEFELIELSDNILEMKKDIPDTLSYITYRKAD